MADAPSPRPASGVAHDLQRVFFLVTELEREVARVLGVGATDYRALSTLMQTGPLTVGELAAAIGASHATTTAAANRLEAAGRLRRTRTEADQRKVRLHVTETTAAEVLDLMAPPVASVRAHVDGLDAHDREVLATFTAALAARLDDHLTTLTTTPSGRTRGRGTAPTGRTSR